MRISPAADRLTDLTDFGAAFGGNPGNLRCRFYVPDDLAPGAALVVVLHGCTQDAAGYDRGSGWSALADRHGFALLFPEQQRANNANVCFTWFAAEDTRRGGGEVASIAAMVRAMREAHAIDPARIFVTGLSAGGAMAGAMLAAYPDLFAAGAIIAGLPYGCAGNVQQALQVMGGRMPADAATLGGKVRAASAHKGPWPRVSIWQGGADHTVAPSNADAIAAQWADVHALPLAPARSDAIEGATRSQWLGADGAVRIEKILVPGMAHGTPLKPGTGAGQSGRAGPHMIDVGISSTDHIAAFFGIAGAAAAQVAPAAKIAPAVRPVRPVAAPAATGVQAVIEDALRAAGLMR